MRSSILWLLRMLYDIVIGWLIALIRLINECSEKRNHNKRSHDENRYKRCQVIPPHIYKRPDPLIYSQSYLMSLGLAVTWDNPDIQIYSIQVGGTRVPISSSDLAIDTDYEIQATIYNGSSAAPAIGMPVDFSYLSFGIGTNSTMIGSDTIDLPVKAAPGHPAIAKKIWRTPKQVGHYCIQVKLNWADDANPNNNLGQENTTVGIAHSPALFEFEVFNRNVVTENVTLVEDAYTIPGPVDCEEVLHSQIKTQRDAQTEDEQKDARRAWCSSISRRHAVGNFPVPEGWTVTIDPQVFPLPPGHSQIVKVATTPPSSFHGIQAININGFDENKQLLGGVTLYTKR